MTTTSARLDELHQRRVILQGQIDVLRVQYQELQRRMNEANERTQDALAEAHVRITRRHDF